MHHEMEWKMECIIKFNSKLKYGVQQHVVCVYVAVENKKKEEIHSFRRIFPHSF